MLDESFFNVEFFRTLFSVLTGGFISLVSIFIIEFIKNRQKTKEDKKLLYNKLLVTLKQIGRIDFAIIEHRIAFNFHRRNFEIRNDDVHKEQAEYTLKLCNEGIIRINTKLEEFDSLVIKYGLYFENDVVFEEISKEILDWTRPLSPNYFEIKSLKELHEKFRSDIDENRNKVYEFYLTSGQKMKNHISKKLI